MKDVNWREIVEIVGVVSIVGSLLLLATEVRQSNNIASATMEANLGAEYNRINFERATNADFAKLYAKMADPASHLITATENEQIKGVAWTYVNIYWSAQAAHDNGLMSDDQLQGYAGDLGLLLERRPALKEHFVLFLEEIPGMSDSPVFAAVTRLVEEQAGENQ